MRRIAHTLGQLGTAVVVLVLFGPPVGAHSSHATDKALEAASDAESAVSHRFEHKPVGKIILGLGYSGTPFAFTRDGEPRGLELELAQAVAEELEVEIEVRWLRGDELLPALEAGEVQLVNVGAVRGELPAEVDVVPYLLIGEHVVVRRDNPFAIHAAEDLSGTMVVATMASPGEAFAREIRARVRATGKAPVEVHTMPMAQYTPVAVLFAHASAYFAPTAAAALQTADPDARVKVVAGLFQPTGHLGFGLRVEDAEFKMYLRLALARVVVKGVYGRLLSKYHIPDDGSPFR